ncbi:transcriptional regulator NanR [Frigidibacter sp. ROC022]|uniref:transcriptional regulator NanR n=1 Tax=Frigidibacter sp. ROC022 TaxID=2971796 RepID=UPI00215A28F7|nr:transcriptional regulator NanR [Frigidibacter sp. ROC022]MCR8722769.1 transcriptional regulator NanR [Frigidibacter sp. ROC022]
MNQSEPIKRRKLSHEVLQRLEDMIMSGELQPGDVMPSERALMDRFQVGRPAIREAMQAMEGKGLVSISHGERAKVLELNAQSIIRQVDTTAKLMLALSGDSLEHLKSARVFFERGIVREAAIRATPADVERLRSALRAQQAALGDSKAFIHADMRFHMNIAQISSNPIFVAVSEAMLSWLEEYHTELLIWSGKENITLVEHEEIIDRIARQDAPGAEEVMVRHLERSRNLYQNPAGQAEPR